MSFYEYIKPELLVLIPVMYLIGMAVKKSRIKDKYIPLIIGLASVLLCILWVLADADLSGAKSVYTAVFTAIAQGVLIAGASVYADQIYKQSKKDKGEK